MFYSFGLTSLCSVIIAFNYAVFYVLKIQVFVNSPFSVALVQSVTITVT